ncbi:hypothetical protein RIF29_19383 [Crotalaria pallida]|uniref:Uncharacterized protein n=1 Tax=Crotalaria pallida TaxID=3830 RepID=A0AAN9EZC7_CROPI
MAQIYYHEISYLSSACQIRIGSKDMENISIADLKPGRENRLLHVRVNRAWKVMYRTDIILYMHVVLIDAQGEKIQATI